VSWLNLVYRENYGALQGVDYVSMPLAYFSANTIGKTLTALTNLIIAHCKLRNKVPPTSNQK
jgi:hypothetical protein